MYSTEDDSQETSPPIVTIDDKGQSISTAVARRQRVTGAVSPSTKEPSVAELTQALIHFIASKLVHMMHIHNRNNLTLPCITGPGKRGCTYSMYDVHMTSAVKGREGVSQILTKGKEVA